MESLEGYMSSMADVDRNFQSSSSSLTKALRDNKGTYTLSKDGSVTLDLNNAVVKDAIAQEIMKLRAIKDVKR